MCVRERGGSKFIEFILQRCLFFAVLKFPPPLPPSKSFDNDVDRSFNIVRIFAEITPFTLAQTKTPLPGLFSNFLCLDLGNHHKILYLDHLLSNPLVLGVV